MSSVFPATAEGQLRHARTELESGLRAGTDQRAERLLAAYPALAADPEAAIELVYTEFVVRQELGQTPTPAEWFTRFPQWRADLEQMFQVHDVLCQSADTRPGGPRAVPPANPTAARIPGYEILDELGRGGMGVVYRARHTKLNRIVAVKAILRGELAGSKERERFRREAEAAARLDHPNIVRVYEVGEHDDRPYCAMEYVAGGPLADRMTSTPWPITVAVRLVAELARAADHAHQRGVVHRDLKPQNILLSAECRAQNAESGTPSRPGPSVIDSALCTLHSALIPKIVDFGLAKCLSDSNPAITRAGDVVGTPMYMAPEQAAGRADIGPPADVWALGVILYELLTGHPPFRGDSAAETLQQVRSAEPVPPRQLRAKLPRDLDTICVRCLQKEPHRRYASAAALADDLDRWTRGQPIAARPVRWPETLAKWARREPAVAGLSAGIVVVLLLGLTGVFSQWHRADRERTEAVAARNDAMALYRLKAAAQEDAEARLYATQIAQAALDIAGSRTAAAERRLDDCKAREPDRCRWEWEYLKRRCRTHLTEFVGHTQPVTSVVYTPDGRRLVSGAGVWLGTAPGEVKVWDADTGALLHTLPGPARTVYRVAVHPAGDECAAGCGDGLVYRWSLRDGCRPLPSVPCGNGAAFAVAYHPDGRSLAVGGFDGSVQRWAVPSGRRLADLPPQTHNVFDLAFSPTGDRLAVACKDGTATVWATTDGRLVHELRLTGDGTRVTFDPTGRLLATAAYNGEVTLWDAAAGAKRAVVNVGTGNARALAFRPDDRHLVCGTRDADLLALFVRGQHADPVVGTGTGAATALAYRPDAARLAVAREDAVIRVWDLTAPPEPRAFTWEEGWVEAVAVSPDGRTVAAAFGWNRVRSGNRTRLVRLASLDGDKPIDLVGHDGNPTAVAYRPDGRQLASADTAGGVLLWEPLAGATPARLDGHVGAVHGLAYSPDGRRLATAGADRTVRLWDVESRRADTLDHPAGVRAVAFSDDGRLLATAGEDRLVRVWDTASRTLLHTLAGHRAAVTAVAFRPGTAELASADDGQELRFWAADTGQDRTEPVAPATAPPADEPYARSGTALAFSPDGRRLAFGGLARPVQLWDPDTRRPLIDLGGASDAHKHAVAFTPDGRRLLTASRATVQVWDAVARPPAADQLARWHDRRADADSKSGDPVGAAFHADRLLALEPWRADAYARRGEAHAIRGRAAEAAADHARALALSAVRLGPPSPVPGDGFVWMMRGEACAHLNDWAGAADAYRFAVWHEPNKAMHWANLADAQRVLGNAAAHRAACREAARRFTAGTPTDAELIFHAAAADPTTFTPNGWASLGRKAGATVLAAALYRAGRPAEALKAYPTFYRARAWDMLLRAMTHHRLNEPAEAERWRERARVWITEADRQSADPTAWGTARWGSWNERAEVKALLREAETVFGSQPSQPTGEALEQFQSDPCGP